MRVVRHIRELAGEELADVGMAPLDRQADSGKVEQRILGEHRTDRINVVEAVNRDAVRYQQVLDGEAVLDRGAHIRA